MRLALGRHDFAEVFRLLRELSYSQNEIGRLTGLAQPEVYSVIHGRRISSYRVIARIANGLGIPHGHLGISRCTCPPVCPHCGHRTTPETDPRTSRADTSRHPEP